MKKIISFFGRIKYLKNYFKNNFWILIRKYSNLFLFRERKRERKKERNKEIKKERTKERKKERERERERWLWNSCLIIIVNLKFVNKLIID
jgi:uncharacterized membrane protein